MLKKFLIGAALLVVVIGGAGYYAWSNLDSIVKSTIEKYGTVATQAAVKLSSVHIAVTSGEGSLKGLSVANPNGFTTPKALEMDAISVKLDPNSVMGTGPVIIREIVIEKPAITVEMNNSGGSNLQALQKNVMAYVASTAGNDNAKAKTDGKPARKVIINDLYVRDGQLSISQPLLLQGKTLGGTLPTLHLTNIGKAKNGALPAEVAKQVLGAISASATKVAANELLQNGAALKGVLGKSGGKALQGLLGK